jgi:phosphocarrier protein
MVSIDYVITDELGIHARPAGMLVKMAGGYKSSIMIGTPKKMVDAKRIMGVMGLALKQGNTVTMTFEGPDEEDAAKALAEFMKENI